MNEATLSRAFRLVAGALDVDQSAIRRESMDSDWAPVERWRIATDLPGVPASVVIKTRRRGEMAWGGDPRNLTAELRALTLLGGTGLAPAVLAADDDAGVIVMEDVVDAITAEVVLFADEPAAARDALVAFAAVLGQMHAAAVPVAGPLWNPAGLYLASVDELWAQLSQAAATLGFPSADGADADIIWLRGMIAEPTLQALTHGDVMPCNVLIGPGRTVLIDFESANPRHIALDGACLALSFPHYRYWAPLPNGVVAAMTAAWRAAIAPAFGLESGTDFDEMLAAGALALAISRLARLSRIADETQPADKAERRRTQIVHTVGAAVALCRRADCTPDLAEWLAEVVAEMRRRWPEASREPRRFPAFNGGSRGGWTLYHDI